MGGSSTSRSTSDRGRNRSGGGGESDTRGGHAAGQDSSAPRRSQPGAESGPRGVEEVVVSDHRRIARTSASTTWVPSREPPRSSGRAHTPDHRVPESQYRRPQPKVAEPAEVTSDQHHGTRSGGSHEATEADARQKALESTSAHDSDGYNERTVKPYFRPPEVVGPETIEGKGGPKTVPELVLLEHYTHGKYHQTLHDEPVDSNGNLLTQKQINKRRTDGTPTTMSDFSAVESARYQATEGAGVRPLDMSRFPWVRSGEKLFLIPRVSNPKEYRLGRTHGSGGDPKVGRTSFFWNPAEIPEGAHETIAMQTPEGSKVVRRDYSPGFVRPKQTGDDPRPEHKAPQTGEPRRSVEGRHKRIRGG